jgi:hypothetical protein
MAKKKNPIQKQEAQARKIVTQYTKGKNAAGQTNGQFEQDPKRRGGQFSGAGDPPRMHR